MIQFKKYHGCGNNFILVKEMEIGKKDYHELAQELCNCATGIGADGLIIVREKPDLEMLFFNKDGTSAPMCGNGIRCFAAFCYDEGITKERRYSVRTLAGNMTVALLNTEPFLIKISMGKPSFHPEDFGVRTEEERFIQVPLETLQGTFVVDSLFMGTVHTVVFVEEFPSEEVGKQISNHPIYTEKTNVNFVKRIDSKTLEIRTYERGVGMTPACGTGACASVVIGNMHEKCDAAVTVKLPYGELIIEQLQDGEVTMSGPAVKVFEGTYIGGTGR